jgi:ligand-binding sensor domain-containing protein
MEDQAGNAWFSRFGVGLARLGRDGHLLNLPAADGLPVERVRCLFQDREGNLWAGIDRGGLVRLRVKQFQVLDTTAGLSDPVVLGICQDAAGAIWASTYGGGLNRWADGKFTTFNFGPEGSPGYVFTVFPDRQGRLWVGTRDNGVFLQEAGRFRNLISTNAIPQPTRAIFQDRSGVIWLGSGAGVYTWRKGQLTHFAADTELAGADVRGLAEDTEGGLWRGGTRRCTRRTGCPTNLSAPCTRTAMARCGWACMAAVCCAGKTAGWPRRPRAGICRTT